MILWSISLALPSVDGRRQINYNSRLKFRKIISYLRVKVFQAPIIYLQEIRVNHLKINSLS